MRSTFSHSRAIVNCEISVWPSTSSVNETIVINNQNVLISVVIVCFQVSDSVGLSIEAQKLIVVVLEPVEWSSIITRGESAVESESNEIFIEVPANVETSVSILVKGAATESDVFNGKGASVSVLYDFSWDGSISSIVADLVEIILISLQAVSLSLSAVEYLKNSSVPMSDFTGELELARNLWNRLRETMMMMSTKYANSGNHG